MTFPRQEDTTKDTKSTKVSEYKSFDAVLEFGYVEVDQQARLDACQFHVGQQLSLVDPLDLVDALQFDNQLAFDQNVNAIATIQPNSFVFGGLWMFEVVPNNWTTGLDRIW